MYICILAAIALLFAPLRPIAAQIISDGISEGDARAFAALRATQIGALTPLMTPAMVGRQLNGAQLGIRYALTDENSVRSQAIAGSAIFALGMRSTVALTAGVTDGECDGCSPGVLLGLGGDARVYEGGDPLGSGTSITIAVSGDVGYAQLKPSDDAAFAFGVGAPVAVSLATGGKESMHLVPFFTPVFGIGWTNEECGFVGECTKSGTHWVLGGGLGFWNPMTSISASIGVNQVMLSGAKPTFGVNVIFGGR